MGEEDLRRGVEAARAGRGAEARAAFRAVLRKDPLNETALLWLAYLDQDPRASLAYIARALEASPKSPRARAALRWARQRMRPSSSVPPPARQMDFSVPGPSGRRRGIRLFVVGLLGLVSLLVAAAWIQWAGGEQVQAEPPSGTAVTSPISSPSDGDSSAVLPSPSIAPPVLTPAQTIPPTPTATPLPSPTPSPSPSPTPSPTATPLPLPTPSPLPPIPTPAPPSTVGEGRWIDVDLTRQVLTAYEGTTPVRSVLVSTGLPRTPTPVGQFRIWVKLRYDDMEGPGYYLTNVPYVMYFYGSYSLHGTYWHNNFGHPMSHGCVNLPTQEAEWLFNWAEVGTLVNIHH